MREAVLAARLRLAAAQNSLAAQERVLQLVESRYEQGAVSGFDLTRQRAAVAVARARIPALEEAVDRQENGLAILLGRPPQGFAVDGRDLFAVALPSVDTGLPSELLLRRPDLLDAEAGLRAADADVSAARAAFFPRLDLTAALSGVDLTGAAGIASSLAAGLVAPIFSGGRLEGGLERAEARHAELVAAYRQQILVALVEGENALLAGQSADRQEEQLRVAVEQAESALAAAETRYAAGAEDLLGVLDAQQTLLNANESLVTARARRLTATVDLIRALGGGWEAGGRA
jgi:NodT family efflux transporter outer membrane factor (OMF) lipoprotein